MRISLARLAPRFSANRMVSEYNERLYRPAETMLARRSAGGGALAAELATWAERLRSHFPHVRWGRLDLRADGSTLDAEVEIYLDDIDPGDVVVELFAEPGTDRPGVHAVMFERRVVAGTAAVAGIFGGSGDSGLQIHPMSDNDAVRQWPLNVLLWKGMSRIKIPDRPAMRSFWHPASTLVRGKDFRPRRPAAEWLRLEALGARDVDVRS